MKKILIAYYSKTGNSKNAAQEIGKVLSLKGMQAEVLPFEKVGPLSDYQGVIIGAPINAMQWHPSADQFVLKNSGALQSIPTAFFSLSAFQNGQRPLLKKMLSHCFRKSRQLVSPVSTRVFPGIIPDSTPSFLYRLAKIDRSLAGKAQDLESVNAWAVELAGLFL